MAEFIIRDEIKKHETENYDIHVHEPDVIIPTRQQFIDHIFTDQVQDRNKLLKDDLLLKLKTANGKEFKVCVWELECSSEYSYRFYGYCGYVWYGSGLYTDKEGYGMRLVSGDLTFQQDGTGKAAYFKAMKEKSYHR